MIDTQPSTSERSQKNAFQPTLLALLFICALLTLFYIFYNFSDFSHLVLGLFAVGFGLLLACVLLIAVHGRRQQERTQTGPQSHHVPTCVLIAAYKQPLTTISSQLNFLRESNRLRPKDLEALNRIEVSTAHVWSILDDLQTLEKLQSDATKPSFSAVSIERVVKQVMTALGPTAASKEIVLRDITRNQAVLLTTDQARMSKIMQLLLRARIRDTQADEILISYKSTSTYVAITICTKIAESDTLNPDTAVLDTSMTSKVEETHLTSDSLDLWIVGQLAFPLGGSIKIDSSEPDVVILQFDLRKIAQKTREGIL
jgi:K+-sensing histidine kinase KdpD